VFRVIAQVNPTSRTRPDRTRGTSALGGDGLADLRGRGDDPARGPPYRNEQGGQRRRQAQHRRQTKRAVREALNDESEIFAACRDSMYAAGGPLFARAQEAGLARPDMDFVELLRMVAGITATTFDDDAQRDRVLSIALDGVRASR
jgi:hypothetical protein